jgi:asparagine N-glycosylation enzyme membrane subunit Stt3
VVEGVPAGDPVALLLLKRWHSRPLLPTLVVVLMHIVVVVVVVVEAAFAASPLSS